MSTNIQPFDLHRMFIGDLPWLFTLEIVVRTGVIYVYSLLLIRWLGQRAVGQLSLVEFLLVIALGSAVGDPMFYPNVPLLHAMIVVTLVVLLNRWLDRLISRSSFVERVVEGAPLQLIDSGVLNPENMDKGSVGREELFEQLRLQGVEHLGTVRQAYLEQGGQISLFCYAPKEQKPGLQINPPWELVSPRYVQAGQLVVQDVVLACTDCGNILHLRAHERVPVCERCHSTTWTDAVWIPE